MTAEKVTRRKIETGTVETYEIRTPKLGPIAIATKDYAEGPIRAWSWRLVDGLAFQEGKSFGSVYRIADVVEVVQARLRSGLKRI